MTSRACTHILCVSMVSLALAACSGSSGDSDTEDSSSTSPGQNRPGDDMPGLPSTVVVLPETQTPVADVEVPTGEPPSPPPDITDPAPAPAPAPAPIPETDPAGEPDDLARLEASLARVAGLALVDLNQALSSGTIEPGSTEDACLGGFDPALGESLLQIDCPTPLAVGSSTVLLSATELLNGPECHAALAEGQFSACDLAAIDITIPTSFVSPPPDTDPSDGFTPQRPQPIAGATIQYNTSSPGQLIVESLPSALTGVFFCQLDLMTGLPANNDRPMACGSLLGEMGARLDELLPPP